MNDVEGRAEVITSVRLRAFGFDDIHPLWGGCSCWVTDDLIAKICAVDRAQGRQRARSRLTPKEWREIERLVAESGLLQAQMPQRMGLPDEGRPSITVVTATGETVVLAKWANDRVPAFDRVYERLVELSAAHTAESTNLGRE